MNFSQLKEAFEIHTGVTDETDPAELALWFNEAQLDLAWELSPVKKISVDIEEGGSYTPPDNWLCVIGSDRDYRVTSDGKLLFASAGTAEIYYRELPTSFSGIDGAEECELHLSLHYLLPIFAAARYWDKEAEGDSEESMQANPWMSYYYQGKTLARSRLFGIIDPVDSWKIRG